MARRNRDRRRSGARKEGAQGTVVRPARPHRPEPRPHFHYERRPGYLGDYEIQLTLLDTDDGPQAVVGRIRAPEGEAFELTRRVLDPSQPRLVSDAAQTFGVPPGLDPAVMREILWECRAWVEQDNARRGPTRGADEGEGGGRKDTA